MTQQILLRVVNATKYYYKDKKQNKLTAFLKLNQLEKDIILKNVTVHLYQGEVLGIIGDQDSGKELIGKLMIREISPNIGKVSNNEQTFLADVAHKKDDYQSLSEMIVRTLSLSRVKVKDMQSLKSDILTFAELKDKENVTCQDITEVEYAQLLLSIVKHVEPTIAIFSNFIQYLNEDFQKKFSDFMESQKKSERAVVLIDDRILTIEKVCNYLVWMTYGQVRKDGAVKEVLNQYRDYNKKYNQLQNKDQKELYDLKWKIQRSELPVAEGEGYKRMRKYHYGRMPKSIEQMIFYGATFIAGIFVAGMLMFLGVGEVSSENQKTTKQVIATNSEPEYISKDAYIISLTSKNKLNDKSKDHSINVPRYSLNKVVGENQSKYKVRYNNKEYTTTKNNFYFFNPAGLYEEIDWSELEKYVDGNYLNYIDFYNSFMHKPHKQVSETLTAKKQNKFVEQVEGQKVQLIFNHQNKLAGFTFSLKNKNDLIKKHNISGDFWVVKSKDGYMIADLKENKWIYIQL